MTKESLEGVLAFGLRVLGSWTAFWFLNGGLRQAAALQGLVVVCLSALAEWHLDSVLFVIEAAFTFFVTSELHRGIGFEFAFAFSRFVSVWSIANAMDSEGLD